MKYILYPAANASSLWQKIVAITATVVVAVLLLMFSAALLAVIFIAGTLAWGYIWWKTRALRKQMRSRMQNFPPEGTAMEQEVFGGEVIEGEVIRVNSADDGIKR